MYTVTKIPCEGCTTDCYNWQMGDCRKSYSADESVLIDVKTAADFIFMDKMKKVRKFYSLYCTDMDRLLAFSEGWWKKYEDGEAKPSLSYFHLINITFNANSFLHLIKQTPLDTRDKFKDTFEVLLKQSESLCKHIDSLVDDYRNNIQENYIFTQTK